MSRDPGRTGPAQIVGYRAHGRLGDLGVVTQARRAAGSEEASIIVIRGGVSNGLVFVVPRTRVREIVHECQTVVVDADIMDFVPRLTGHGDVELRLDR